LYTPERISLHPLDTQCTPERISLHPLDTQCTPETSILWIKGSPFWSIQVYYGLKEILSGVYKYIMD
jgi:hypothetical protein